MSIHSQYLRSGAAPAGTPSVIPIPDGIKIILSAPNFTDEEMEYSDTIDITAPDFTDAENDLSTPISLSYTFV